MRRGGHGSHDATVQRSLDNILKSPQFQNSSVLQDFLKYIVNETLEGRSDRIKSYSIGIEVFGRATDFDASSDAIVRNAAGRLRAALATYYQENGVDDDVVIELPKGRYVPVFRFREDVGVRGTAGTLSGLWYGAKTHLASRGARAGIVLATLAVILAVAAVAALPGANTSEETPPIALVVQSTTAAAPQYQQLATRITSRLAPALTQLGLARIIAEDPSVDKVSGASGGGSAYTRIALATSVHDDEDPSLSWRLKDMQTGVLLWAERLPVPSGEKADLDAFIGNLVFGILGESGALSRALPKVKGARLTETGCLTRAQVMELIKGAPGHQTVHKCLEAAAAKTPQNPTVWALLGIYYTLRDEWVSLRGDRDPGLLEKAEKAVSTAVALAPDAYFTDVALMHLTFRRHQFDVFDDIKERLLNEYPGDAYLKIRIANRLTRRGEALRARDLLRDAYAQLDLTSGYEFAGLAFASYQLGDYAEARHCLSRIGPIETVFSQLLDAALHGRSGNQAEARDAFAGLLKDRPDFKDTFRKRYRDRGWSDEVINDVAEGLRQGGIAI